MNDKQNCRFVYTVYRVPLPSLSKVFEKFIYSQSNTYMTDKFSKYQTEFCKKHNTQNPLLSMIENWKSNLNQEDKIGAIYREFPINN